MLNKHAKEKNGGNSKTPRVPDVGLNWEKETRQIQYI